MGEVKRVLCRVLGHEFSGWTYAVMVGLPRPVCHRCGAEKR